MAMVEGRRSGAAGPRAGTTYRREPRYGYPSRDLPLPEGCSEQDVKATCNSGIFEIRHFAPRVEEAGMGKRKIPIAKS